MIVGQRLRTLRKKQKITAEELGGYLGVSGQQVLRYETNQNDMTTDNLVKIANFFDVSADYLLGMTDNPVPYENRKGLLTWRIDVSAMLNVFQPEFIGRLVRSTGIKVVAEPERIKISSLLQDHSPKTVALFVKELGMNFTTVIDQSLPDDTDSE